MDESAFLRKFAKALGQEDTLDKLERKHLNEQKEKKALAKLERMLAKLNGVELPEEIVEEVIEEPVIEVVPEPIVEEIIQEPEPVVEEPIVEQQPVIIEEAKEPVAIPLGNQPLPQFPEKDIVTKSVEMLAKIPRDDYVAQTDAIPNSIRKEIDLMKKTLTDLHRFARNSSGVVAGGGAGDVTELDHRTVLVHGDYTFGRKDYYIGVNSPTPCTITLPCIGIKAGRMIIVKDESGNCSTNPITVVAGDGGTIDNDTSAIMGINNMTLQFIYRDGWRII